jgi:hypothetical protein
MSAELLGAMHALVRDAAWPGEPGESVKAAIRRASRRLGLAYSRAHQHWYGRARTVPAAEWIAAQDAQRMLRRDRAARLRAELAALEAGHAEAADRGEQGFLLARGSLP